MCLNVLRKRFDCLRWISGSKRGPGLGDDRRRRLRCPRTVMLLAAERIWESDHTRNSDEHPQQMPRAKAEQLLITLQTTNFLAPRHVQASSRSASRFHLR